VEDGRGEKKDLRKVSFWGVDHERGCRKAPPDRTGLLGWDARIGKEEKEEGEGEKCPAEEKRRIPVFWGQVITTGAER